MSSIRIECKNYAGDTQMLIVNPKPSVAQLVDHLYLSFTAVGPEYLASAKLDVPQATKLREQCDEYLRLQREKTVEVRARELEKVLLEADPEVISRVNAMGWHIEELF